MSRADLVRLLAAAAEAPGPATARHAELLELGRPPTAAEHTELFAFQLHPYASVHLGPEGKLGGVARDRIAGFFRVLDIVPPPEPDHLLVLLHAYAQLVELDDAGDRPRVRHARTVLLHEHLASWLSRFTRRAHELAPPPYRRWASHLDELLGAETDLLGAAPTLPAHLREAPSLAALADEGREPFAAGVLTPVRSGLVLARADLARAAKGLGLGLRIGERAYALNALLEQDGPATLGWVAAEARRQREQLPPGEDATTRFWRRRLDSTAELLAGLVAAHRVPLAAG